MRLAEKPGAVREYAGNGRCKAGTPRLPFHALEAANQLRILLGVRGIAPQPARRVDPGFSVQIIDTESGIIRHHNGVRAQRMHGLRLNEGVFRKGLAVFLRVRDQSCLLERVQSHREIFENLPNFTHLILVSRRKDNVPHLTPPASLCAFHASAAFSRGTGRSRSSSYRYRSSDSCPLFCRCTSPHPERP